MDFKKNIFLTLTFLLTAPALGQSSGGITEVPYEPVNPRYENEGTADTQFLQEASVINKGMIRIGEIATSRADDEVVRSLGEKMVFEHNQLQKQAEPVARELNVDLTSTEVPYQVSLLEEELNTVGQRLSTVDPKAFSQVFRDQMAQAHQIALDHVLKTRNDLSEDSVKDYARLFIDAEEEHLLKSHSRGVAE